MLTIKNLKKDCKCYLKNVTKNLTLLSTKVRMVMDKILFMYLTPKIYLSYILENKKNLKKTKTH